MLKFQDIIDDVAVVGEPRNLALTAEFAGRSEPSVESSGRHRNYFERVEKNAPRTLGLIVGVDALELTVEKFRESGDIASRLMIPFDEPLMPPFVSAVGINGGISIRALITPKKPEIGRAHV